MRNARGEEEEERRGEEERTTRNGRGEELEAGGEEEKEKRRRSAEGETGRSRRKDHARAGEHGADELGGWREEELGCADPGEGATQERKKELGNVGRPSSSSHGQGEGTTAGNVFCVMRATQGREDDGKGNGGRPGCGGTTTGNASFRGVADPS